MKRKRLLLLLLILTTCGVLSAQDLSSGRAAEALPLVGRPSVAGQNTASDQLPLVVKSVSGFVFESRGHANGVNAIKGDVNNDKKVDISDIVAIINTMAGTASYSNADVNTDGSVNISDVVQVINIIANKIPASPQKLVVWMKSGEKVYFNLSEQPETTFGTGKLIITTSKSTVNYNLPNVIRYTYEGTMPAISSAKLKPGELRYSQGNDLMQFEGLPEGIQLELYSNDGKLLKTEVSEADKPTTVSLSGMPSGTYILKGNDATIKFEKR
jgi:hypothetical protein